MTGRKNEGFTLIELLMVILTGTIVTLAATTILLLGFRIFFQSNRLQEQQTTTRILMTALEDMAAEGTVKSAAQDANGNWNIYGEGDGGTPPVLMSYSDHTIYVGGNAVLTGVTSFTAYENPDTDLLTIVIETEAGSKISTSIYCRLGITAPPAPTEGSLTAYSAEPAIDEPDDPTFYIASQLYGKKDSTARAAFVETLLAQQGSEGTILGTEEYFSQWYITAKEGTEGEAKWGSTWNAGTPWCACFLSWALAELPEAYVTVPQGRTRGGQPFWYANVDEFMAYFRGPEADFDWVDMCSNAAAPLPLPGDVIFFDWTEDWDMNTEHVGVVLYAENGVIHTIEGNSYGTVALRRYDRTDKAILGYGRLPWTEDAELPD